MPRNTGDPEAANWTAEALAATGAANVWSFMSVDSARGLVFLPTASAAPDFFGGTFKALKGLIVNLPFIIGIAFVEETAWMKFSVTRLQEKYSALRSCLTVGVAWGLWYLPMLLVGEGVPDGYPWPVFLLSMVCLTVLLGWAYSPALAHREQ